MTVESTSESSCTLSYRHGADVNQLQSRNGLYNPSLLPLNWGWGLLHNMQSHHVTAE